MGFVWCNFAQLCANALRTLAAGWAMWVFARSNAFSAFFFLKIGSQVAQAGPEP